MGATAVGVGMGVQALGGIFGANSQSNAQNANLQAAQQNRAQLMQLIQGQMMGGQNPYAQSYLAALQGMGGPGTSFGRPQASVGATDQTGQQPSAVPQIPYNSGPLQTAPNGAQYQGSPYYQPDPSKPYYQPNTALPYAPDGWTGPQGATPGAPSFSLNSNVSFDQAGGGGPTDGGSGEFVPTEVFTDPANGSGPGGQAGGGGLTGMGGQIPSPSGSMGQVPGFNPYNPLSSRIQDPFTYNPSTLGAAPQISGAPQVAAQQLASPQIQMPGSFGGAQIASPGSVQASQIQAPGQFNLPMIQAPAPVGTQGMNAGQDALLQMMRANITPPNDAQVQQNLQRGVSGQAFDPSDLLKSMQTNEKTLMDQQVAGLEGSAGSLGQRFGTAMQQNESQLRQNLGAQFNQQNQQVLQTAFENAANRGQQSLGLQTQYQQQLNQLPFQQAQLQQQAAQAGGGLVQQGSQLNLQAQIQNALNNLQAQQGNQQAGLQAGMQGQQLAMQAALANQNQGLAGQEFNVNTGLQAGTTQAQLQQQAGLQNQSIAAQLAQAQAGMGLQAGQANQSAGLQAQGMNLDSFMRSALANQQMQGQYGQANANILNQAGQYNAQAGMQAQGFNAQQGQYFNQLQQALLGQAQNAQQWQQGQNSGLIGLLAGLPMPQQQMSPWGSAIGGVGGDVMTAGLLAQFLGRPSTGGAGGGQVQGGNEYLNWAN